MGHKPIRFIDGWSESSWKSLTVKAIRIGWPEGLRQAAQRLSRSSMKSLLLTQIFEDIYPTEEELPEVMAEIERGDYEALCRRNPHQGRHYTQGFCDLEHEAVAASKDKQEVSKLRAIAFKLGLPYLPPRALNTFYTWLKQKPDDPGQTRTPDDTPWTGMPMMALDVHNPEGRKMGRKDELMSGYYHRLQEQSVIVAQYGWEELRRRAWAEGIGVQPFHPQENENTLRLQQPKQKPKQMQMNLQEGGL